MHHRLSSILIASLSILYISLSFVDQGIAMSRHHGNGGGANPGTGGSTGHSLILSTLSSIDAPAFVIPVPEPSTIVLVASGVFAVGLWRLKKHTKR